MRGVITHRERSQQIRDYSGLRYGKITPTDIDGMLDFQNRLWVVIELKSTGAKMPFGQKLALERLTDDLEKIKPTICFIADHNQPVTKDIIAHLATVTTYRYKGAWRLPKNPITLRDAISKFLEM